MGTVSAKSARDLKSGWLITAVLVGVYIGFGAPRERRPAIASVKGPDWRRRPVRVGTYFPLAAGLNSSEFSTIGLFRES